MESLVQICMGPSEWSERVDSSPAGYRGRFDACVVRGSKYSVCIAGTDGKWGCFTDIMSLMS